jgi:hypothetical protein
MRHIRVHTGEKPFKVINTLHDQKKSLLKIKQINMDRFLQMFMLCYIILYYIILYYIILYYIIVYYLQ